MNDDALPYGPELDRAGGDLSFMTMLHTLDDEKLRPHSSRFDEKLLAACIRMSVMTDTEPYILRIIILEIANALDHPTAKYRLRLVRPRAGRSQQVLPPPKSTPRVSGTTSRPTTTNWQIARSNSATSGTASSRPQACRTASWWRAPRRHSTARA